MTGPKRNSKDLVPCTFKDLVGMNIDIDSWEQLTDDRAKWRATVHEHIMASEARRHEPAAGTHRMRSGRYAAQQESSRRCSGSTTTLFFLFVLFVSAFYFYLCFYIL